MLIHVREKLLDGQFPDNLKLLQSYPPVDFQVIFKLAKDLHDHLWSPPQSRRNLQLLQQQAQQHAQQQQLQQQQQQLQHLEKTQQQQQANHTHRQSLSLVNKHNNNNNNNESKVKTEKTEKDSSRLKLNNFLGKLHL